MSHPGGVIDRDAVCFGRLKQGAVSPESDEWWFNYQKIGISWDTLGFTMVICCIAMDIYRFYRGKSLVNGHKWTICVAMLSLLEGNVALILGWCKWGSPERESGGEVMAEDPWFDED